MKAKTVSFYEWQKQFSTHDQCLMHIAEQRWPNDFQYPHCGHDHGYFISTRSHYECAQCHKITSITSGTLFHATKLPLTKWFWAIYWVASDKGGISALRLSKLIGVHWRSAYLLLKKLRNSMGHRDSIYRLSDLIELDDAFVGGKKPGKRGRGAQRKASVLIACENRGDKPGFIAMEVIDSVSKNNIEDFAKRRIKEKQTVITDAYPSNNGLKTHVTHIAKVTPPEEATHWLPWVHIAIANLKRYLLGTYHGASKTYLQEYLNEFCYRFNRRFWEYEIPNRLLRLCIDHRPMRGT